MKVSEKVQQYISHLYKKPTKRRIDFAEDFEVAFAEWDSKRVSIYDSFTREDVDALEKMSRGNPLEVK